MKCCGPVFSNRLELKLTVKNIPLPILPKLDTDCQLNVPNQGFTLAVPVVLSNHENLN